MKDKTKRRGTVNFRTAAAVLLLAAVLLGCIFLPARISRLQDRQLMERQYSQANDMTVGGYYHETGFLERLQLFVNSKDSSYATSQFVEVTDYQVVYSALEELAPELEVLREAGLLPDCVEPDLSGKSSYLGVITSMDIRDPYMTIAYRELTTSDLNSGITCFFRQDVDSGKIIEFWFSGTSYETLFPDTSAETLAHRWAAYLGLTQTRVYRPYEDGAGYSSAVLDSEVGAFWLEYTEGTASPDGYTYYSVTAQPPAFLDSFLDTDNSDGAGTAIQSEQFR